jgi:hypothetical protein
MAETGRYTSEPAKADAAVEAMKDLGNHCLKIGVTFRNGVNFDALGDDDAFGKPAKRAAIELVDKIATGVEAAGHLLLAVPMMLEQNGKSVLNQQFRALTAVQDATGRGGWRTPSSFGGRK